MKQHPKARGLAGYARESRFDPGKSWRFDFALADAMLAIEAKRRVEIGKSKRKSRLKAFSYRSLGLKRGAIVLDVGCGIGQDAHELRLLVGAAGRVVGIDYSEEMIAEARRRSEVASFRPEFLVGEAHRISFHDDTFDACRADRVLQHLDDPRAARTPSTHGAAEDSPPLPT